jgi:putative transposase
MATASCTTTCLIRARPAPRTKLLGLPDCRSILAQIGYKRWPGSRGGKPSLADDNTLVRQFDFDVSDKAWVTDITYIRPLEGFAYVAVAINLYSHRVASWPMQSRKTNDVLLQALHMAVWRRKSKQRVFIHSDQDAQVYQHGLDWVHPGPQS